MRSSWSDSAQGSATAAARKQLVHWKQLGLLWCLVESMAISLPAMALGLRLTEHACGFSLCTGTHTYLHHAYF